MSKDAVPLTKSGRLPRQRPRAEVIAEALRLAHEIGVRARALESTEHSTLALEQLEADLELAGHLAREVRRLIDAKV